MKRIVSICLTLFIVSTWLCAASAADILPAEVALRANAQLRAEPSEASESLMILMKGQKVTIVDVSARWLRVEYGRFVGYIRSDLVEGDNPENNPVRGNEALTTSGGNRTTLKMGMRGEEVKGLQLCLSGLGYAVGSPDGIFGTATRAAVISFQKDYKLTVDGIVGKETYQVIDAILAEITAAGSV